MCLDAARKVTAQFLKARCVKSNGLQQWRRPAEYIHDHSSGNTAWSHDRQLDSVRQSQSRKPVYFLVHEARVVFGAIVLAYKPCFSLNFAIQARSSPVLLLSLLSESERLQKRQVRKQSPANCGADPHTYISSWSIGGAWSWPQTQQNPPVNVCSMFPKQCSLHGTAALQTRK